MRWCPTGWSCSPLAPLRPLYGEGALAPRQGSSQASTGCTRSSSKEPGPWSQGVRESGSGVKERDLGPSFQGKVQGRGQAPGPSLRPSPCPLLLPH